MKKFLLRILLTAMGLLPLAAPTLSYALDLGRVDTDGLIVSLNHGNMSVAGRYLLGDTSIQNVRRMVRCTYDFATLGGAVTTIKLQASTVNSKSATLSTCLLPKGAIVTQALIDVITTATDGVTTSTISVSTGQTAADLLAATSYTSFTSGSLIAGIPVDTAATAIKLTADSTPSVVIATNAWTAGKFYVLIEYLLSQTL